MNRRRLLQGGLVGAGLIAGQSLGTANHQKASAAQQKTSSSIKNYIPAPRDNDYNFVIQKTALNPDGKKEIQGVTVNGTLPGPEIRVKKGEDIRILTKNTLIDQATSVHWHGLLLPAAMDGVPDVSNIATPARQTYIYEYPIRQTGSYWYHSHFQFQEQVGMFGAFIIEDPDEPNQADLDVAILISDWLHRDPSKVFEELREPNSEKEEDSSGPDLADVDYASYLINGKSNNSPWSMEVETGQSVRLRVTGAGASTYFRVSLEDHELEITHVNGPAVKPVIVDEFLIGPGEGYDARVHIKKPGSYTLHAVTQSGNAQVVGVIHTPGNKKKANMLIPREGKRPLKLSTLRALEPTTLPNGSRRNLRIELGGDMKSYTWMLNNQAYPNSEPLKIREGERVGVKLVNKTMMWHPMHLHGHFFRPLLGQGEYAPLMHTISVPPRETIDIEFIADNPGSWIFHCHNLYHLDAGMARDFVYEV